MYQDATEKDLRNYGNRRQPQPPTCEARAGRRSRMKRSNKLSNAQIERLAILAEELAEAGQAIGKILRHGYDSRSPFAQPTERDNRGELEKELGDVLYAMEFMDDFGDIELQTCNDWKKGQGGKDQAVPALSPMREP